MLHPVDVLTHIFGAIDPLLFSVTFLYIVSELSLILRTVYVSVLAVPIGHIVFELTVVHVAFCVPESALSFSFVERPLSLVVSTVSPDLYSIAMSDNIGQ